MFRFFLALIFAGFFCVGVHADSSGSVYDPVSMDPPDPDAEFPPVLHELLIPSNDVMLSGFMLGANGKGPHPTVVLLHGFPGNEKNLDLAQSMRRAGYNVLFFHYRGAWGSQGDYTMDGQASDVAAVLDYLRLKADTLRVDTQEMSIIGHSLGGFTALRATSRDKEIQCVVGLAAFNFEDYASFSEEQKQAWSGYADMLFMLNNLTGAKMLAEMQANSEAFDLRKLAPSFSGRSVLLIVGSEDTAVPPAMQSQIVAAYEKVPDINLKAEVIPGDHSFSVSRIRMQRMVIGWMNGNCR